MNKFAPKLTHHLQCFIYAAYWHKGYSQPVLARTFDISAQTVNKICRKNSGMYHHVKKEADRLGLPQMWQTYNINDLEARVLNMIQDGFASSPVAPGAVQRDTGEGVYYMADWQGRRVAVDIAHLNNIPENERAEFMTQPGYYAKDSKLGWNWFNDRPFRSIGEALRYYAENPPDFDN